MSSGITFAGLGSGLDTDSIISQLMDIERRPVALVQNRQARLEQQKSVLRNINSSLLNLQGSVSSLAQNDLFSIVNVSSDDKDRVQVEATNEAAAGTFSVEVEQLAQARSLSSRSFNTSTEALNLSGEFIINGKGVEITEDASLLDIRDAINQADIGVSAQLLTVADTDNRLIVTSSKVGSSGFELQDASSENVLEELGFTSSQTEIKNAFVDGGRSDKFLEVDQNIATLLNLSSPASGTVNIGDKEISIDLSSDSLNSIRDKINAAAPTGVNAAVIAVEQEGLTRYQLEVQGTTNFIDDSGVLETVGMIDSGGQLVEQVINGAETAGFSSTTTALGSLLGLAAGPNGTVSIGGEAVDIDLSTDSLTAIQTKINDAAPTGVTATIINGSDDDGKAVFRLRIEGTADLTDDSNVLESLGFLVGSNRTFESVSQALTSNVGNQQRGALLHATDSGAKSDVLSSNTDTVGALVDSSASSTVTIGDKDVAINLSTDSLNDIRDKINAAAPSGVAATVNAIGASGFELEIDGTTQFEDADGILEALGVLASSSALAADTTFDQIVNVGVQAGDSIAITGTNHAGNQISGSFTISSTNMKIENLLTQVEQLWGEDVSASIDGSGRIVVQSTLEGESSLMVNIQALNEGGGSLDLGFLAVTAEGKNARSAELQAGQDALVRINGIALSRSTNTITDAVQGLTMTLGEAEVGKQINITVNKDDTSGVRSTIGQFVEEFNTSMSLINEQFVFDEATQSAGVLAGDSTILGLQSRLRTIVSSSITGLDEGGNALSLIGVAFDRSGLLSIDDSRLNEALNDDIDQVRRLFVSEGTTNSSGVEFISSTSKTAGGTFAVNINQAPGKARLEGTVELLEALTADQLVEIQDRASGRTAKIEVSAGQTLDQVVAQINAELASDVAEVRSASLANTSDGTAAITADTTFDQIFGAGVISGDSIRINGTSHNGNSVTNTFVIDDPATKTVNDLLSSIRNVFNGEVSTSINTEGEIVVTDNSLGDSQLTVVLVENNEGGGSLNFGSLERQTEGRLPIDVSASNVDGKLVLEHGGFGASNGFSITEDIASLGLTQGEVIGKDAQGTINGEDADGYGRVLSGQLGSEMLNGLALRVTLSGDELVSSGNEQGNVQLVHGIGRLLSNELGFITDEFDGSLKNREDAIDDTIAGLDKQIESLERRIGLSRTNLVRKFAALEGSLATLQSEGNFLTSQLAGLAR